MKIKVTRMMSAILIVCLAIVLTGCGSKKTSDFDPMEEFGCDTLNVYNWGEYIGEDTVEDFEEKYNVKVNYSMFGSNEEMYTKLLGGESYDILIPSDYMIERLTNEGKLASLDLSLIPNLSNLHPSVQTTAFDPTNQYSVPYFWGTVGILYDTTVVDAADVEEQGYNVFKNEKYKGEVYLYDSERDSFMMALKALGYSMNTTNQAEIDEAYNWLIEVKEATNPVFVQDEVIDGLINGEKAMGVVYSGDAAYIQSENPNMAYFEPKEGTNFWVDAMVIPENSTCGLLAHEYINYNLEEVVAYNNSEYVGYTSSVAQAKEDLESDVYADSSAYQPREGYELDEAFRDNEEMKKILSELWIKVKAAK